MRTGKYLLLFLFLFAALRGNACLNYYYSVDKEGNLHSTDYILTRFNTNFNLKLQETALRKNGEKLKTKSDYHLLSDYALALLKTGKVQESLDILAALYRAHPGEYQLAANLGTAYELHGDVDSALKYIRRGMELNANAHGGSEWVHVKVLLAKKEMAANPGWLSSNSVLGLSAAQEKDSMVRKQIDTQVRERFPFCKGPDPYMASLLADLGDCYSNTASLEYAKVLYDIARVYYGDSSAALQQKTKEVKTLIKKYEAVKPEFRNYEHGEGEHMKLTGMRYQDCLQDNNLDKYTVDWTNIETDVKKLLAFVNLVPLEKPVAKPAADTSALASPPAAETPKETAKQEGGGIPAWAIAGGIAFLLSVVLLVLRKRNKQ